MTRFVTATAVSSDMGPLTKIVYDFVAAQGAAMAKGVKSVEDWDPVAAFIDPKAFKRVGAYLEELDWPKYREFLTGWAAGGTHFEMTEFRVSEVGDSVFQEIEERHRRGDEFIRKNVIAVYRFNDQRKIIHLDIYEQASDSGQWIKEAAAKAMAGA
jgi:hypothetical protein